MKKYCSINSIKEINSKQSQASILTYEDKQKTQNVKPKKDLI